MLPTLSSGQIVLGIPHFSAIRAGDIVMFLHDGLEKIKRIQHIDDDQVYLVGDNPAHSTDSRTFGWLPISVVQAKIIWPRRRMSKF